MNLGEINFLFTFNYWTRDRILEQAARLSTGQYLEPQAYGHGSLRNELVHILGAEWIWRVRCQEQRSPTSLLQFKDFPTVEHLQIQWQREEKNMRAYLGSLTDKALEELVTYRRTGGETRKNVLWHLLLHIVNHGTEHRSQAAAELTAKGCSPGDIDLIHFLRAINA